MQEQPCWHSAEHLLICNANKLTRVRNAGCILHMNSAVRDVFHSDPIDGIVNIIVSVFSSSEK